MFNLSSRCNARYPENGRAEAFEYDDDGGLCFHVIFSDESSTDLFVRELDVYNTTGLISALHGHFVWQVDEVQLHNNLDRIALSHYKRMEGESASPPMSLNDLKSPPGSVAMESEASKVEYHCPFTRRQSIESEMLLSKIRPEKCHLWSRTLCPAEYKHNDSNLLALTREMHEFLDGINQRPTNIPAIKLVFESKSLDGTCFDPGDFVRYKVQFLLECRDVEYAGIVAARLKDGVEVVPPLSFRMSVFVREPDVFEKCLKWKQENTEKLWATVEVD